MIQAHRGSGKPFTDFEACTGIDLSNSNFHDDPLTPEQLSRARTASPIQWDKETTLPNGTVLRSTKGCVAISTPFHEDGKGWNP